MPEPNGQGVADPNAAEAGGEGAGTPAGAGEQVTDQEFELTAASGQKVKVKTSDIIDDRGVPFKNRMSEETRRRQELEEENQGLKSTLASKEPAGGEGGPKPGEFQDPIDGSKYTQEDIDRMFMTGEGAKAHRILVSQIDVNRIVDGAITRRETKSKTLGKYPDLSNPQTPFFKRVALYMSSRNLYGDPEGLAIASARVAELLEEEGVPFNKVTRTGTPEGQRLSQTGSGAIPGSSGSRLPVTAPELDEEGKAMCAKLGVDPVKVAKRLESYLTTKSNKRGGE